MLQFGLDPREFHSRYFEKQPWLATDVLAERPMSWRDLDQILYVTEPDERLVQMYLQGQIPAQHYIDEGFELGRSRRRLNKQRFYTLMKQGATLVLNRMEDCSLVAKRLCHEVAQFAAQPTTGNAYISFNGTGTFGQHWDTHDVFAIQLLGKKRWQLFAPTLPLPLSHQTSQQSGQRCPITPTLDCVLNAGDMLYIPRGWWHQVTPLDVGSLHLSVGSYAPTLYDYVMWACSRHLPSLPLARHGLQHWRWQDAAMLQAQLQQIMQAAAHAVLEKTSLAEFSTVLHTHPVAEFHTELMLGAASLNERSRLTLTTYYPLNASSGELHLKGVRIPLTPAGQALLQLLNTRHALSWPALCSALPQHGPDALREAALELARHDLLSISDAAH